jgi:hypothetical protein
MGCGCGSGSNVKKVTPIKRQTNSENGTRTTSAVRIGTQPAGRRIIKRRAY